MAELECTVNCEEFRVFRSAMQDLVGWPVPFSWNEDREVWIAVRKVGKPAHTILNNKFSVLREIIKFLSEEVKPEKTWGFYVSDDGIWRKEFELIARFKCK